MPFLYSGVLGWTQHSRCDLLPNSSLQQQLNCSNTVPVLMKRSVWMEGYRFHAIKLLLNIRAAKTNHIALGHCYKMSQRLCLSAKCKRARRQSERCWPDWLCWLTAGSQLCSGLLQPAPSKAGLGHYYGGGWPQGPFPKDKLNGTWETPNNCVSSSAGNSIVQEPLA